MAVVSGDPTKPQNWEDHTNIGKKHEPDFQGFEYLERFAFYERAKNAYAVLSTTDRTLYGNIILK
jgi:L-fucose mutarotase